MKNNALYEHLNGLDVGKGSLRKFGTTIAVCLGILAVVLFFRHKPAYVLFGIIGVLFLTAGLAVPLCLKHVYRLWMGLAFCLGWVNTRIILCIIFYGVLTPISLIMRIFGKDFLNVKWDKTAASYWIARADSPVAKERYEKTY